MRSLLQFIFTVLLSVYFLTDALSQDFTNQPFIAVLNIDSRGLTLDPAQLGNITRTELSKLQRYQVMDRYDVDYVIEKNEFSIEKCYGRICMVEAGKILKTDKMLTGSAEVLGETITITLRLIDVGTETIEKTQVMEFLNLRNQIQTMIRLTMKSMFDEPIDDNVLNKLTKKFDYESAVNFPEVDRLNLSGPRMGFTAFTGELSRIYSDPKSEGGFDAFPLMFQFGYQFEVKYLNQGDFQALFEFIPIVTGLDQGRFIPSISVLNGMRSNRTGWEFAFGPIFYGALKAEGYYDDADVWHLSREWRIENPGENNPYEITKRLDSRGEVDFDSGFVFAVGKTFKSGRLNIPVNGFFIPNKTGHRFGISMGFNASRYK
ncbi:MAG: hypothetical protein AAF573_00485 [Bacteroidota bacterium]